MQDEAGAPLTAAHESSGVPPTAPDHPRDHLPEQAAARHPHRSHAVPPGSRRPGLFVLMGVTALAAYAADQISKVVALDRLTPGQPVGVVGDSIRLNLIRNAGAAFSIGNGATWVMTLIAFGVLVFILRTARRIGSPAWALALGLLLGGSLGNLTDRMVRAPGPGRGHVVDFIDYFGLFIGNVADIAIVGAAAFIAILAWRGIGVDGIRPHHGRHEAGAAGANVPGSVGDDGAAHV